MEQEFDQPPKQDLDDEFMRQLSKEMESLLKPEKMSVKEQVSHTMEQLKQSDSQVSEATLEDADQLNQLMKELEGMLQTGDLDSLMGGLLDQIMTKELLHEPMKELSLKYPSWFKHHKDSLDASDLQKYTRQFDIVQEIVAIYDATPTNETSPEDSKKVVDLMQEMQSLGNPPEEILKELAPGLQLGPDGTANLADLAGDCNIM